jgi:hypothetical protein
MNSPTDAELDRLVEELIPLLDQRDSLPWGHPGRLTLQDQIDEISRKIEWVLRLAENKGGEAAEESSCRAAS